jgi:hypothetical protein
MKKCALHNPTNPVDRFGCSGLNDKNNVVQTHRIPLEVIALGKMSRTQSAQFLGLLHWNYLSLA